MESESDGTVGNGSTQRGSARESKGKAKGRWDVDVSGSTELHAIPHHHSSSRNTDRRTATTNTGTGGTNTGNARGSKSEFFFEQVDQFNNSKKAGSSALTSAPPMGNEAV